MFRSLSLFAATLLIGGPNSLADQPLFPNADFETGTLQHWTTEGPAFTFQPTRGDNPAVRGRESSNLQGEYWIGGFEKHTDQIGKPGQTAGDGAIGTLTSDPFTIEKPYITFRIGAGYLPGEVGVKLLVGDQVIDMGTGVDSETMVRRSVDVKTYLGKSARVQVFDTATGGWGHINVDDFRGTDQPVIDSSADFAFTGDLSASGYPQTGYDQPLRPQFHFSSRKNWLNDPNGMVYDGEKYHLFFQHNPAGTNWGNMTWGHATSPDMIRWTQTDHALLPYRVDGKSGTIFSGTAVMDHNNSLGKQVGDTPTMVAFFTFAAKPIFYQAMAYSTDLGQTWTYWNEGRPVVENQGFDREERDPKVFWHEPTGKWVMAIWVQRHPGRIRWFTSENLVDWTFASDLMRDWAFECVDVIFLPVDGDAKNQKCVIYDASFDYEIGTFDGQTFHSETEPLKHSLGNFYAAQTFNQAPNGRAVQVGWMRGGSNVADHFDVPHNQQMSFPTELTLRTTDDGVRLFVEPIAEIETLAESTFEAISMSLEPGINALADAGDLDLVDLDLVFDPGSAEQIIIDLPRLSMVYDVAKATLTHNGIDNDGHPQSVTTLAPIALQDGKVKLRVLVDRLSVEVFAGGGQSFAAHYLHPEGGPAKPSIHAVGGTAQLDALKLRKLQSAWE